MLISYFLRFLFEVPAYVQGFFFSFFFWVNEIVKTSRVGQRIIATRLWIIFKRGLRNLDKAAAAKKKKSCGVKASLFKRVTKTFTFEKNMACLI